MASAERNHIYIIRNGEIEHVWEYKIETHRFNHYLYCRGTESEVREYIEKEFPEAGVKSWHHALTEAELEAVGKLHLTIYCAPEIRN